MSWFRHWRTFLIAAFSLQSNAYAVFGIDAAATIPWLIKILTESVKQYEQLKELSTVSGQYKNLLTRYHQGIDEALQALDSLPIQDENILGSLKGFREALSRVEDVYGETPKSPETDMLRLHDDTVAESMKVISQLKSYAERQERNADMAQHYANDLSPKGAARVAVETNAQILHTLNQVLRINGQMLKIQSESLAFSNKAGKDSVLHYSKVHRDLGKSLKNFRGDFKTPELH